MSSPIELKLIPVHFELILHILVTRKPMQLLKKGSGDGFTEVKIIEKIMFLSFLEFWWDRPG
jgi:hypothetical protein